MYFAQRLWTGQVNSKAATYRDNVDYVYIYESTLPQYTSHKKLIVATPKNRLHGVNLEISDSLQRKVKGGAGYHHLFIATLHSHPDKLM